MPFNTKLPFLLGVTLYVHAIRTQKVLAIWTMIVICNRSRSSSDTDSMPYDPIQGQGHGGPKVVKVANFKVHISSAGILVNKRLTGQLW